MTSQDMKYHTHLRDCVQIYVLCVWSKQKNTHVSFDIYKNINKNIDFLFGSYIQIPCKHDNCTQIMYVRMYFHVLR